MLLTIWLWRPQQKNDTIDKLVNTVAELTATNATLTEQLKKHWQQPATQIETEIAMAEAHQPEEEAVVETATTTPKRGLISVTQMPIAGHVGTNSKKATQAQIVGSTRTQGIRRKQRARTQWEAVN